MRPPSLSSWPAWSVAVIIAVSASGGCSTKERATTLQSRDLRELGLLYHNYCAEVHAAGPRDAADLNKAGGLGPELDAALRSGDYVLLWQVNLARVARAGNHSDLVLGWHKDTPEAGGTVLMGDGVVLLMTSAEFNAAKRAPTGKAD